jgi:hypothetical protein
MTVPGGPLDLEHAAWEALSTSGEAATAFYGEVLADEVLMVLPGGLVVDDRDQALGSMGGEPWDWFELSDERVVDLADLGAVVAYRGRARRGRTDYEALFTSTYVRHGDRWRLVVHQQTPV